MRRGGVRRGGVRRKEERRKEGKEEKKGEGKEGKKRKKGVRGGGRDKGIKEQRSRTMHKNEGMKELAPPRNNNGSRNERARGVLRTR